MHSKSKSKPKSHRQPLSLKDHKNKFTTNSSSQLTLLPHKHNSQLQPTKPKTSARSKNKKQDIIKKMQQEIEQIKGQILQLKSQSSTANMTQLSTRQQLSNESTSIMQERGPRKISQFNSLDESKINAFQLHEQDKQNRNVHNLQTSIVCNEEMKQPSISKSSASVYHQNRVKYRNLEQSSYYIDYYLLN